MTYIPTFNKPIKQTWGTGHKHVEKDNKKSEIIALIKDGLSRQEIADALGISLSTLGSRMYKFGISYKKMKK